MPFNILVTSPLWLPLDRTPVWNESIYTYDSGVSQAATNWWRPLYKLAVSNRNYPRAQQNSLHAFYNQQKGSTIPFLMTDPYDFQIRGVVQVASGVAIAANSGFNYVDANSYRVMVNSSSLRITSTLSGTLISGSHYVASLDNGFIRMIIGKANNDTITASGHFFRKVRFSEFSEQSFLHDQFSGAFTVEEIMP